MSAIDKTNSIKRLNIDINLLDPNPDNPNKMSPRQFDLLVDNLEQTGMTDPILVRDTGDGRYRIVGGHHRFEGAKYLEFQEVPCTIIDDPDFDEDKENFQVVRMNAIRGKMDPTAFTKMYEKVSQKYSEDLLQDMYGFAEEAEFKKLIKTMSKQLPKELQGKFKEAAKEIKTIDGLAKLLNSMFAKFGDTLPYGYMVFDYGGRDSIWLRVEKNTMKAIHDIGATCVDQAITMDDLFGGILQSIAKGEFSDKIEKIAGKCDKVELPDLEQALPTKDNIHMLTNMELPMLELFQKISSGVVKDEDGCWIWQKAKSTDGYGVFKVNNKTLFVHRVAYMVFKGEIQPGMKIGHKCGKMLCANPDHLVAGDKNIMPTV